MKAKCEIFQDALDRFLKNPYWRSYYENAPEVAKEKIETEFYASVVTDKATRIPSFEQIWREIVSRLGRADYLYLASVAADPRQRKFYEEKAAATEM